MIDSLSLDFTYNKPNQQREQNPRQSAQSYGGRGGSPDSESLGNIVNCPFDFCTKLMCQFRSLCVS